MPVARVRNAARALIALAGAMLTLGLPSACVTESVRPSPVPMPLSSGSSAKSKTNAATRFSIIPLGEIPFDAWTIPLVSPDAQYIATQIGTPPTIAELLNPPTPAEAVGGGAARSADARAVSAPARSILRYRIAGPNASANASGNAPSAPMLVQLPAPDPGGPSAGIITLGRSASMEGALVERAGPRGTRTVGILDWVSGQITWLQHSGDWIGLATFLPQALGDSSPPSIACTRLPADRTAGESDIVILSRDPALPERVIGLPGSNLLLPMATSDPTRLYVLVAPSRGGDDLSLKLCAFDITAEPRLLDCADLHELRSLESALQAAAPFQTPWPSARPGPRFPDGCAVFSNQEHRTLWFAPRAGLEPLPRSSAAAVPLLDSTTPALAVATDRQLSAVFPAGDGPASDPGRPFAAWSTTSAPILAGAVVPRSVIWRGESGILAFQTPDSGGKSRLQTILIVPANRKIAMPTANDR